MRTASFADTEFGDDLIVSFYLMKEDDPTDGYSFIIMRTPKYEHFLHEHQRRAKITCDDEELESDQYLESIEIDSNEKTLKIIGTINSYEIDFRKVEAEETSDFIEGFEKLNFDHKFKIKNV